MFAGRQDNNWQEVKLAAYSELAEYSEGCTRRPKVVACGEAVSKEALVEARGADGFLSADVGRIAGIAVYTGNAGRQENQHYILYLLGQDGLLLRVIPKNDEGQRNDYPFMVEDPIKLQR